MQVPSPGQDIVFKTKQRRECMDARLVLDATGITAAAVHQDGWWLLVVSDDELERLQGYRWPGNVRELEHVVARAFILGDGDRLRFEDLPAVDDEASDRSSGEWPVMTLAEATRRTIDAALRSILGVDDGLL